MADENTPEENQSNSSVATASESPSEDDIKRAEEFKEKANEFFKSNYKFSGNKCWFYNPFLVTCFRDSI